MSRVMLKKQESILNPNDFDDNERRRGWGQKRSFKDQNIHYKHHKAVLPAEGIFDSQRYRQAAYNGNGNNNQNNTRGDGGSHPATKRAQDPFKDPYADLPIKPNQVGHSVQKTLSRKIEGYSPAGKGTEYTDDVEKNKKTQRVIAKHQF